MDQVRAFGEYKCKNVFRFLPGDLAQLMQLIEDAYLPRGEPGEQHTNKQNCLEALLITLFKLGSPGDLFGTKMLLHRSETPETREFRA